MSKLFVGYQVYSARDDAAKDLKGTLQQIAAMGYDGVEFAGFYGHSAQEVLEILKETGLKAVSSHVPYAEITADPFGVIAYHKTIGCEYIAIPFLGDEDRPGTPGFADVLKTVYCFGDLCKKAGIQLLYHNHDFEFVKVSGMFGLDFLYAATPACLLKTELDVCWVKYAGQCPVAYINKYAGRAPVVHFKDFVGVIQGRPPYSLLGEDGQDDGTADDSVPFEFRPVGYGCQDFPAIKDAAEKAGALWVVVEQDQSVGRAPLEAAKMSRDYLKSIGL